MLGGSGFTAWPAFFIAPASNNQAGRRIYTLSHFAAFPVRNATAAQWRIRVQKDDALVYHEPPEMILLQLSYSSYDDASYDVLSRRKCCGANALPIRLQPAKMENES